MIHTKGAVTATWIEPIYEYEIYHTETFMNGTSIRLVYYVYRGDETLAEFDNCNDAHHFVHMHRAVKA